MHPIGWLANLSKIQLDELIQQATEQMNSGDFKATLDTTRKIQCLGSHFLVSYVASGLLIDTGVALSEESIVREGVGLLQKDLGKIVSNEEYTSRAYYNFANGFYALFTFRKNKDPFAVCFRETELDTAKFYFRKALNHDIQDPTLKSEIFVNLGNCCDELGRVAEAQECYDEALRWNPHNGIALGNKGQSLFNYAALSGEHQGTLLIEAYSLLSKALKLGVTPEAENTFVQHLKYIRKHFPDKRLLDKPPTYPGYEIKAKSRFEKFLIEFCLEHKLYLNMCNFCQKCDASIGDTIVIKRMLVEMKEREVDPFLRLSSYLNNIKQDFTTARFLLATSRFGGLNLDFVDNNVTIIDTFDHTRYNIYIQLLKEAFKSFYNILDKIACFIDYYLKLGIPEDKVDFCNLWYSDQKTKKIKEKVEATKNLGLNALFDIHRDFEKGGFCEKLRETRNALTHRFVNIKLSPEIENSENMTEESLLSRTLEIARIVRSAIIYLLCFVNVEETKKEQKTIGPRGSLTAREIPKSLKKR